MRRGKPSIPLTDLEVRSDLPKNLMNGFENASVVLGPAKGGVCGKLGREGIDRGNKMRVGQSGTAARKTSAPPILTHSANCHATVPIQHEYIPAGSRQAMLKSKHKIKNHT